MRVKRVGMLSLGLTLAGIYGGLGLLIGIVLAFFGLLGGLAAARTQLPPYLAPILGLGAVVVLPLIYGTLAFVTGVVVSGLYNVVSRFTGGIEFHAE